MPDTELDRRIAALGTLLADLEGYIDRKAAEKAAPAIAIAERAADKAIQEVEGRLQAELQRERDLTAELRRCMEVRDKAIAQGRDRLAAALGHAPGGQRLGSLTAEVERRLAEDAATIERLRGEVLDAVKGNLVADVPLPDFDGPVL